MNDALLRRRIRDGTATSKDFARAGLVCVPLWDGNGNGDGDGHGNGNGYGDGHGYGHGYGDGDGNGHGNGNGYGDGNGHGNGDGHGGGDGDGNGNGKGETPQVKHTDLIPLNTPVVLRSYVSGVVVGRLQGGENGAVAVSSWRWLRRWEGTGNEGSVYDLIHSQVTPTRRGPFEPNLAIFQQADVMVISEECYQRLSGAGS